MEMNFTSLEVRVLGCLLEKETTTTDQYPLSLNALTNACNQKSNRDPVMELDEATVRDTLEDLMKRRLVTEVSSFGSRVEKFKHRFCNTEFSELQLGEQGRAILCTLFLRGPQTPGELRTRTNRLCTFSDIGQVESELQKLAEYEDGALVVRLPREAGKRESRFAQLFCGDVDLQALAQNPSPNVSGGASADYEARISALEQELSEVKAEVQALKDQLAEVL